MIHCQSLYGHFSRLTSHSLEIGDRLILAEISLSGLQAEFPVLAVAKISG
jgi:hypothetical protein